MNLHTDLPPDADIHQHHELTAARFHDRARGSCLGAGQCQECGRSVSVVWWLWRDGDCLGGRDCNVDWAEYDKRVKSRAAIA